MTEDEKDAELSAWVKDRYDVERVLTMAEYSESTDALVLAGEIRRLRKLEQRLVDLIVAMQSECASLIIDREECRDNDWDEGLERIEHDIDTAYSVHKVLVKLLNG